MVESRPEDEFLVRKVMSLEGAWYEVDCKFTDGSYQTLSKLITFLTKNSTSVLPKLFNKLTQSSI